jgi:hypothetical protein
VTTWQCCTDQIGLVRIDFCSGCSIRSSVFCTLWYFCDIFIWLRGSLLVSPIAWWGRSSSIQLIKIIFCGSVN